MVQQYGSLINLLSDCAIIGMPDPEVGMGATYLSWTDRHAGTIIEVIRTKSGTNKGKIRQLVWQRDRLTGSTRSTRSWL